MIGEKYEYFTFLFDYSAIKHLISDIAYIEMITIFQKGFAVFNSSILRL